MDTGSFTEQGEDALDPALHRASIDDEATLGEALHDIGVTQALADVPADGYGDDIIGEAVV